MNGIQRVLADLTVIVVIVGIGWSLFLLALRREAGPWWGSSGLTSTRWRANGRAPHCSTPSGAR